MQRILALVLLLTASAAGAVQAQVADETLVPRGRLRLAFQPSYTHWDSRFGERLEGGSLVEEEEPLGMDLTDATGASVFAGVTSLQERIRELTGVEFSPLIGSSRGVVSHDVTRIEVGAHLGVFDWLTVGVMVPWVQNRTALEVAFRPDTVNANLGLNPALAESQAVSDFLSSLESALGGITAQASAACESSPGSQACADASDLRDRTSAFYGSAQGAYFSSALFPLQGTSAASALGDAATDLSQDLAAAGVGGLGTMVFATDYMTEQSLATLPSTPGSQVQGSALQGIEGLWEIGDVEVSALLRLLQGEVRDSAAAAPRFSYSLGAGVVARLGTGTRDATNIFLDLPTGDGQTDIETRVFGSIAFGSRLGVRGGVRYGVQRPVTLLRRVAPPETIMPAIGTLRAVRWSPASYFGFEVEPALRLTESLALFGSYRVYSKADDGYEQVGDAPAGSVAVDVADLERESGVTVTHVGLGVRYSTVGQWREGTAGSPMELYGRFLYATSGSGGQTPVSTRVELGIRLFRGIWGDAPASAGNGS